METMANTEKVTARAMEEEAEIAEVATEAILKVAILAECMAKEEQLMEEIEAEEVTDITCHMVLCTWTE